MNSIRKPATRYPNSNVIPVPDAVKSKLELQRSVATLLVLLGIIIFSFGTKFLLDRENQRKTKISLNAPIAQQHIAKR